MRVLVTGGAGFIGSFLIERLIQQSHKVTVLDDLSRGKEGNLSDAKTATLVRGKAEDEKIVDALVRDSDAVFHLAALSRVLPAVNNPELAFRSNVLATEVVARSCAKHQKKLVFSSSREVYGEPTSMPVSETSRQEGINPYGASKIAAESYILAYSRTYGLNYSIVRLSNVYGPRDFDRVIPIFIERLRKGQELVVYGSKKTLDLLYVGDAIDAFIKAMSATNITVNIGSGRGVLITELAEKLSTIMGSESGVTIEPERANEVSRYVADIGLARLLLDWQPKTPLEQGLKITVQWYNEH